MNRITETDARNSPERKIRPKRSLPFIAPGSDSGENTLDISKPVLV